MHLPFKKAMHAIDPIQRLQLLRQRMDEYPPGDIAFHDEIARTFNSLRDLHTTYRLPYPFKNVVTWLPFMIEEYWEEGLRKYMISKVIGDAHDALFEEGAEVLYWNGVPIDHYVRMRAREQAGGNEASRHALALNSLTIRPLSHGLLPEEEWVSISFKRRSSEDATLHTCTFDWLTIEPPQGTVTIKQEAGHSDTFSTPMATLGMDSRTDDIQLTKKVLYAGDSAKHEAASVKLDDRGIISAPVEAFHNTKDGLETYLPTLFRARPISLHIGEEAKTYGYIRIFSFNVSSAEVFVDEFTRLIKKLPQNGLILDIRGNGGGLIPAAELLLQVLSPRPVELQRAQFINTPSNLELCKSYGPNTILDLSPWVDSIAQSTETGSTYSRGFSLTSTSYLDGRSQQYFGPLVLITDALCYSAADMFAAGFQDHALGLVLGTSASTGAGGANVWSHSLLTYLMNKAGNDAYRMLPKGTDLRVALRRMLRTGANNGQILEDFGVRPDAIHQMTLNDLLKGNCDLIQRACELLSGLNSYNIQVSVKNQQVLQIHTENISRIDVRRGNRTWRTVDITEDTNEIPIAGIHGSGPIDVLGYDGENHVSTYRLP